MTDDEAKAKIRTMQKARATLARGSMTPKLRGQIRELDDRIAEAVAGEVNVLRTEQRATAAKVDTALAKLDAALARAEFGGADRDRSNCMLTNRMILTRD